MFHCLFIVLKTPLFSMPPVTVWVKNSGMKRKWDENSGMTMKRSDHWIVIGWHGKQ
jgi:hypothetical protein